MNKGIIDRFRSLPMARSAVLSGRTFADVVYNAGILIVLMLSGLVVGWRVHSSASASSCSAVVLLLALRLRDVVGRRLLGLSVPTVEVAQQRRLPRDLPADVLSNAFVPTETLPDWLQPIAEWNPFSALTAATRELFGNPNPFRPAPFRAAPRSSCRSLWIVVAPRRLRAARRARYRSIER